MIVVGIETSTPHTSVAIGSERELLGAVSVAGKARQEAVTPALERLCGWTGIELGQVGGIAVGIGPGLFTGLRVGIETAKTLAQVLSVPIVGIASLDALAFSVRHTHKLIVAVIDGRRREVFSAITGRSQAVSSEGATTPWRRPITSAPSWKPSQEMLAVGDGAILYRNQLEGLGSRVEFASTIRAHPEAAALVELAVPRFLREEHDRLYDVVPMYLRKSDAEIAWDNRDRGTGA